MAVDPRRVVGVEVEVDRRQRGRGAGDRDPGLGVGLGIVADLARRACARMSPASASSSAAVGGSEAMWRSLWRTTPACSEVWNYDLGAGADDQLGRPAADVDDHASARVAGGPAVAPR